jgi:hypothetical protein
MNESNLQTTVQRIFGATVRTVGSRTTRISAQLAGSGNGSSAARHNNQSAERAFPGGETAAASPTGSRGRTRPMWRWSIIAPEAKFAFVSDDTQCPTKHFLAQRFQWLRIWNLDQQRNVWRTRSYISRIPLGVDPAILALRWSVQIMI